MITDPSIHSNVEDPNWLTIAVVGAFHLGAISALFFFDWHVFLATVVLYWLTTGLGISMGYHRLHTHRSYRVPIVVEYFLAVCGTLTLQGGPISWVATHRMHHQNADQPRTRTRRETADGGPMPGGCWWERHPMTIPRP